MIGIEQFRYDSDNLGYILYGKTEAWALDPGDPHWVVDFCKTKSLSLKGILNTHNHGDHTSGNQTLHQLSGVPIISPRDLMNQGWLSLEGEEIRVIPTPGHTDDSLSLLAGDAVITGDALFIANVGNCPAGRMELFRSSLDLLLDLPAEIRVFPGHDYTERSIKRALSIETGNTDIRSFWEAYAPPPVATTIGDEKRINPYLRAHQPEVAAHLRDRGKDTSTPFACFKSFLELY
jgi:hydroxyacylglutathione hydrolase